MQVKKRKKPDKIAVLANIKLNEKYVLISKVLTDSNISQFKHISVNNVWKECNDME